MDCLGKKCPICDNNFHAYDDVVVCPDCGTPYHRECYDSKGECIFKELHGVEVPKCESTDANENTTTPDNTVCPSCGHQNRKEALFCDRCGSSINSTTKNSTTTVPIFFDPMAGVNPEEEFEDDVTAGEVAKYVKNNTPYYMYTFNKIKKTGGIGKLNFAALLFSGGWMLYRKQYVKGAIITAIVAILMIASTFLSMTYSKDILDTVLISVGLSYDTTMEELLQNSVEIRNAFNALSVKDQLLYALPYGLEFIRFVISIILCVFGNKMYYKHCIKEVKKIKEDKESTLSASERLQTQGGVNTKIAFCLLICLMIINYLPLYLS